MFSEGAEPKIVRAWSADSTVTKLGVGRATNRTKNMTSRLGLGGPTSLISNGHRRSLPRNRECPYLL
jgi:hypothetical protein